MSTLKVVGSTLKGDADKWTEVADALSESHTSADNLEITISEWPTQKERGHDVADGYEQIRGRVAALLRDGAQEARDVADELLRIKRVFEGTDQGAKESLKKLWNYE